MVDQYDQNSDGSNSGGGSNRSGLSPQQMQGVGIGLQGVGQIMGGVSSLFGANDMQQQAEQLQSLWSGRLTQAESDLKRIRAAQPSLDTPSTYYEMVNKAFDDRIAGMKRESIARSFATTAEAAQRYGSRGLGAVIAAQGQATAAEMSIAEQQQARELEALRYLAAAQQTEQQLKEQRTSRDLSYAYDERAAAEEGVYQGQIMEMQAKDMRRAAIGNIAGGVASAVVGAYTGGMLGGAITGKRGMKVRKTPGKFSHKDNPLHVIDDDGKKVAEVTGGEYILNPEQASTIKAMVNGDPEKLRRYVRKLVAKFEK